MGGRGAGGTIAGGGGAKDEAMADAQPPSPVKAKLSRLPPNDAMDGAAAAGNVAESSRRPVPAGPLGRSLVVERRSRRWQSSLGPARSTLSRESGSIVSSAVASVRSAGPLSLARYLLCIAAEHSGA